MEDGAGKRTLHPAQYLALAYGLMPELADRLRHPFGESGAAMTLRVRLFARARDLAGAELLLVEVPDGATVAELRRRIEALVPALAGLLPRCAVAVNTDFADDTQPLSDADEIALLPPVSGGSR